MTREREKTVVPATVTIATEMDRLHEVRGMIKGLQFKEESLKAAVVDYIGEADGTFSDTLEALLVRFEGAISWKSVVSALIRELDIPPSVVERAVVESTGQDFYQLRITELKK